VQPSPRVTRTGIVYAVAAYSFWGLGPVYFKAVATVYALEVLAHRIIWSFLLLVLILGFSGGWQACLLALRNKRTVASLICTALLVDCNWLTYIWAVTHDQVLQASLGYFINPLVSILLGFLFLGEKLRRLQLISVALAALGVLYLTLSSGAIPLLALILAVTFGGYGLIRKTAAADALTGLTVETAFLLPLAIVYLVWLGFIDSLVFYHAGTRFDLLLVASGPVTAIPLLWFAKAARRLRLGTVGFLQYIAPSLQFLLAVGFYGESFTVPHAVSFGCIWLGLLLYSFASWRS